MKPDMQMPSDVDSEHLRLLSIFHYVLAALAAVGSLIPIIHLSVGLLLLSGAINVPKEGEFPVNIVGWMFVIFPTLIILCGLAVSLLIALAGRKLARNDGYTFCLVVAAVECVLFPIGTLLGVFTIMVLVRPSVKEAFADRRLDGRL